MLGRAARYRAQEQCSVGVETAEFAHQTAIEQKVSLALRLEALCGVAEDYLELGRVSAGQKLLTDHHAELPKLGNGGERLHVCFEILLGRYAVTQWLFADGASAFERARAAHLQYRLADPELDHAIALGETELCLISGTPTKAHQKLLSLATPKSAALQRATDFLRGRIAFECGDFRQAGKLFAESGKRYPGNVFSRGPFPSNAAAITLQLARCHLALGDFAQAAIESKKACEIHLAIYGLAHPRTVEALSVEAQRQLAIHELGIAQTNIGQAAHELTRSLERSWADKTDLATRFALIKGQVEKALGNRELAKSTFQLAYATAKQRWGERHPLTADAADALGFMLFQTAEKEKGRAYLHEALNTRRALVPNHPDVATSLGHVAKITDVKRDVVNMLRLAWQNRINHFDSNHELVLESTGDLASALLGAGEFQEAESVLGIALQDNTSMPPTVRRDLLKSMHQVKIYLGKTEEAAAIRTKLDHLP